MKAEANKPPNTRFDIENFKMVVGLGNPGREYEKTYHNAGYLLLDYLLKRSGHQPNWQKDKHFKYTRGGGGYLIKPLVFMNESGKAVREAMKKFGVQASEIVVAHDESDLPLGTYKISVGRGAAGHKGIQSIVDTLHSKDFTRIRIGIRNPRERRRRKADEFVLKKISSYDQKKLAAVFAAL